MTKAQILDKLRLIQQWNIENGEAAFNNTINPDYSNEDKAYNHGLWTAHKEMWHPLSELISELEKEIK
jgi:hypothetical protein